MVDLEVLYFEWLLTQLDPDGVSEEVAHLGDLLHRHIFRRRVGNDINRAVDGASLRKEFMTQFEDADFDPRITNALMMEECSWFEMLIALARRLDFMYDGGVEQRFLEMVNNMGLGSLLSFRHMDEEEDYNLVWSAVETVDESRFDEHGRGGLFPLARDGHPDQREVEIWDQHAAYFADRLEGVLWTSST